MKRTVNLVKDDGICISCGICSAVCHKNAISYQENKGMYLPYIDTDKCNECGLCYDTCPGKGCDYSATYKALDKLPPNDLWVGEYIEAKTVAAKDENLRNNCTSGGFVTALVKHLLDEGEYDGAFLVDTYNYEKKVESAVYRKGDDISQTPKSRYIPVMHTSCIEYILKNREEKLIIVAVPCFIEGLLSVISKYKLNRENYLLLGLFCDKTMNYNIFSYFEHLVTPKK